MRRLFVGVLALLWFAGFGVTQDCQQRSPDTDLAGLLRQKVAVFDLDKETIFDGLAKLNETVAVSFATESLPGQRRSDYPKYTLLLQNKRVSEILDEITALD